MIKEFIEKWEKNKEELENYFRNTKQEEYNEYEKIIKKIIEIILNGNSKRVWSEEVSVIDDGDYQGTQIFIIHKETYQPNVNEYIYTSNYYGSCSGCDTLLRISGYEYGLPNEEQVKEYMLLALHLIQKIRRMGDSE